MSASGGPLVSSALWRSRSAAEGSGSFHTLFDHRPTHLLAQIIEAGRADPVVAGAMLVIVTGGVALVQDVGAIELREFRSASGAVIVVPALAPARIAAELQPHASEVPRVVDAPLVFRFGV